MYKITDNKIFISVRNLVEFILRSGDLDNTGQASPDKDAMLKGANLHRKLQAKMGADYKAEVPLKTELKRGDVIICLEGRADGVIEKDGLFTVDEIKGTYAELESITAATEVHKAQAKCYAYMVAAQNDLERIDVQITYAGLESMQIKRFSESYTREEIEEWFNRLIDEFGKWGNFIYNHRIHRNISASDLKFPFEYRQGQKELAVYAYRTIIRGRKMFVQAPTGIGKTMSMIYPAVKALGEDKAEKIFYLTAKTITRTVAEESIKILQGRNLDMIWVTITAKEKICIAGKPECNPQSCERAKGHFDRINAAVFYALNNLRSIGRDEILKVSEMFSVCPFELSLDISSFADTIICDYNYVFDPNVRLKRYFADSNKGDYIFLVDEAHNLVERARKMYSAVLIKEDFLAVDRCVKEYSKKLHRRLSACNRSMLELKKESEDIRVIEKPEHFVYRLMELIEEMNKFAEDFPKQASEDAVKELYFNVRHFINIYEITDENYCIYSEKMKNGEFMIKLLCIDPSENISLCTMQGKAAIFFSATLLPMKYYCEMLSGDDNDYKVYVDSPFDSNKRMIAVAGDVSARYSRRTEKEYRRVLEYIGAAVNERRGNYLVFFPSYRYMDTVRQMIEDNGSFDNYEIIGQSPDMDEGMRENFLSKFEEGGRENRPVLGLCVLGGIFSEGIDLKGERLIGVFIVGTGIGQISSESELIRAFFESRGENGFEMTYLFPGMNRVLQAAGRVIRTEEDRGIVALLDDRFLRKEYLDLYPKEWQNYKRVNISDLSEHISDFWNNNNR